MNDPQVPRVNEIDWIARFLRLAAIYHLLLGLELIIDPKAIFVIAEMDLPTYAWLVRGLGANVLMFALGFAVAMRNPNRYWPVGLMAFVLKIGITIAISVEVAQGRLPLGTLFFVVLNDVLWIVPLGRYLWAVFRQYEVDLFEIDYHSQALDTSDWEQYQDQQGHSLPELTQQGETLMVFLRHFGCTFCRETMAQLARDRQDIEADGTRIVVVHQSEEAKAQKFFAKYGLEDLSRISDPERKLYEVFDLEVGTRTQVFGWKSWLKGFYAGIIQRHGIGALDGDGYQMPGAFLLREQTLVRAYRHVSPADWVDYCALSAAHEEEPRVAPAA